MEGQEYYIEMIKEYRKKYKLPALRKKKLDAACRSIARIYRDTDKLGEAGVKVQLLLNKYMTERRP